jgi:hypothetical protein
MGEKTSEVVIEYLWVLGGVISVVALAGISAKMLKSRLRSGSQRLEWWMELSGTVLLAFAGIARLGWSIQSWGGDSPAEQLNTAIFYSASGLGLWLLLVGFFLAPREIEHHRSVASDKKQGNESSPVPWDRKILYGIANWALLLAGLANLTVGTLAAVYNSATIAATSLTAGLVLLFAATIDRFESLKGLGMEAKTRQLNQTISEAKDTLHSVRELAELSGAAVIDMGARMGRLDGAPSAKESIALADCVRTTLESIGSSDEAIARALRPWARTLCFDLARVLTKALRERANERLTDLKLKMSTGGNQGAEDEVDFASLPDRIKALERFLKSGLGGLYQLRLEDYPDQFMRLFDEVPELERATVEPMREAASHYVRDMISLRDTCRLRNPERWIRELERDRT